MVELVQSGRLVDFILLLVALEAFAFLILYRYLPQAPRLIGAHPAQLWPTLLSGALLMVAVRFALMDAAWALIASTLAAAGIAHIIDIALRFRAAR
ncbi:MAG: hypothetical protein AB8B88_11670 [Devosiaceae bacterium]